MHGEFGFHPWVNLTERNTIAGKALPGVYLIARNPAMPADYRANNESIIYIGETTDQSLGKRIRQFSGSAFDGRPGHSGGNTFHTIHEGETPESMLWVSVCPVELGEVHTSAYIKYLERRLIWEYVCTYSELSLCNSK